ncbi:3-carboxy-cis,cis-muconate cycloisomerase, partial [Nonomuraea sp. NN258]|uniref:lyase family protein n=1 Tax=Nonomuraea antri TaxID=2730852 RepID=UPI0022A8C42D
TTQENPAPSSQKDHDVGLRLVARFAQEVGLAEPDLPWHVLRTPVADLAAALAFTAGALGKTAADVLVLSRTEIGEVSEGVGGGSSSMPHKHNPVRATMIAAAARQVPALAAVLYGSLAAEDERPPGAWHAEWQPLRESLRLVAGAARDTAELVADLRVHPERMRANLGVEGSTGSAAALVDRALEKEE